MFDYTVPYRFLPGGVRFCAKKAAPTPGLELRTANDSSVGRSDMAQFTAFKLVTDFCWHILDRYFGSEV